MQVAWPVLMSREELPIAIQAPQRQGTIVSAAWSVLMRGEELLIAIQQAKSMSCCMVVV